MVVLVVALPLSLVPLLPILVVPLPLVSLVMALGAPTPMALAGIAVRRVAEGATKDDGDLLTRSTCP
jgi:hypothetical protein